jgi:hypothetical protein
MAMVNRGVLRPAGLASGNMFRQTPTQPMIMLPNGMMLPVGMLQPVAEQILSGLPKPNMEGMEGLDVYQRAGKRFDRAFGPPDIEFGKDASHRTMTLGEAFSPVREAAGDAYDAVSGAARRYGDEASAYEKETADRRAAMRSARRGPAAFDAKGDGYDYDRAQASGMQPGEDGHWGSVAEVSKEESARHGLPDGSYVLLKGRNHETWDKAVAAEEARGSQVVERGGRYYSIPNGGSQDQRRRMDRPAEPLRLEMPPRAETSALGDISSAAVASNGLAMPVPAVGQLSPQAMQDMAVAPTALGDLSALRPEQRPVDMSGATDLLAQARASGVVDADGRVVSGLANLRPAPRPNVPAAGAQGIPASVAAPTIDTGAMLDNLIAAAPAPTRGDPTAPAAAAQPETRASISDAFRAATTENPEDKATLDKEKAKDSAIALLMAGFGMTSAASRPGATALGAMGEGGMVGLKAFSDTAKARREEGVAKSKMRRESGKDLADLMQKQADLEQRADDKRLDREERARAAKEANEVRRDIAEGNNATRKETAALIRAAGGDKAPADVRTVEWMVANGVAGDAKDGWAKLNTAKQNPQSLVSDIFKSMKESDGLRGGKRSNADLVAEAKVVANEILGVTGAPSGGKPSPSPAGKSGGSQGQPAPLATMRYNPATGRVEAIK